jgi:hypothetical protein
MSTFIDVLQVVTGVVGLLVLGSATAAFLSPAVRASYLRGVQLEMNEQSAQESLLKDHA